jgi:hypothetical protein
MITVDHIFYATFGRGKSGALSPAIARKPLYLRNFTGICINRAKIFPHAKRKCAMLKRASQNIFPLVLVQLPPGYPASARGLAWREEI